MKNSDTYIFDETNNKSLDVLRCFLIDDVGCDASYFKKWLEDSLSNRTGVNISELEKNNDKIIIKLDPCIFTDEASFETTQANLKSILNSWELLCQKKAPNILITYDEKGKIKITEVEN